MKIRQFGVALLALPLALILSGCSSSSGGSSTVISVALSPSTPQTIGAGQTIAFTSTLTGDPANGGVNFSAAGTGCTGASCGTFTTVMSNTATYNAPPSVPSTLVVSVTAAARGVNQSDL